MSYEVRRVITIKDSTPEKVKRLADTLKEVGKITFRVHDDYLDDSHMNCGCGYTWHDEDFVLQEVSERLPDYEITVHRFGVDNHEIVDFVLKNGRKDDIVYRECDQWYKHYKDHSLRAEGARPGYYDDPGYGEDYPYLYDGYEKGYKIPAGVMWWRLRKNMFDWELKQCERYGPELCGAPID